jgi:hypothetical protein
MQNQVFRDPSVKDHDYYRVMFDDRICSPGWQQVGPARAYLQALEAGTRRPEYPGILITRAVC